MLLVQETIRGVEGISKLGASSLKQMKKGFLLIGICFLRARPYWALRG
jgi:hypothetical protein